MSLEIQYKGVIKDSPDMWYAIVPGQLGTSEQRDFPDFIRIFMLTFKR